MSDSAKLDANRMEKNPPTLPTSSSWGLHIASVCQQHKFKFKTREEDPSLMNAFQRRNFKLLVDPIEQGISCFEQNGSRQKSQCLKSLLLEKQNHL